MLKNLKRSVLICLTAILASCNYPVKKLEPAIFDFDLNTCELLKITEVKPEIKFEYASETMPIGADCLKALIEKHKSGVFVLLPIDQVLDMKRYYEAKKDKD